ncbi:MAG: Omp28-related outer membrane protein [Bacteroidia bacterium]
MNALKKVLVIIGLSGLLGLFSACEYDVAIQDDKENSMEYTYKVLVETREAAWCVFSPMGDYDAAQFKSLFKANQYEFVVYHFNDAMDIVEDDHIDLRFLNTGFPCARFNRSGTSPIGRVGWQQAITYWDDFVESNRTNCGLAIDASTISDDHLQLEVALAINSNGIPDSDYYLTVLLIEKEAQGLGAGWDQENYFNNTSGPFYNLGDPIIGYKHPNCVVKVVTNLADPYGEVLTKSQVEPNSESTFNFDVDLEGLNEDLRVVAFITSVHKDEFMNDLTVVSNAQFVDIGKVQDFD